MVPHLVDAPAHRLPPPERARAWGQAALRLERAEALADTLAAWRARLAVRRVRVVAAGDPAAALSAVGPGTRLDWIVDAPAAERLPEVAPSQWRDRGTTAWAVPAEGLGASLPAVLRRAGSAGWPVLLPPGAQILTAEAPILELLDFYLFHPGLAVPVEPFHGLLVGLVARRPRTLWELWFGLAAEHFHLDAEGHASLCAAWAADPARRYGTEEDAPAAWRASAAHRDLSALLRGEVAPDPACATCEAWACCGGALVALRAGAGCEVWREAIARLRIAAGTLQRRAAVGRRGLRPARTSREAASSRGGSRGGSPSRPSGRSAPPGRSPGGSSGGPGRPPR